MQSTLHTSDDKSRAVYHDAMLNAMLSSNDNRFCIFAVRTNETQGSVPVLVVLPCSVQQPEWPSYPTSYQEARAHNNEAAIVTIQRRLTNPKHHGRAK